MKLSEMQRLVLNSVIHQTVVPNAFHELGVWFHQGGHIHRSHVYGYFCRLRILHDYNCIL